MLRNTLAVIVGLVAGMALNMALVLANVWLHPLPEGADFSDTQAMQDYFAQLPTLAFALILVAHLGQAFFGGWIAALISRTSPVMVALVVGAISMIGGIMNLIDLPHPQWMWLEVPFHLIFSLAAGSFVSLRRKAATPVT